MGEPITVTWYSRDNGTPWRPLLRAVSMAFPAAFLGVPRVLRVAGLAVIVVTGVAYAFWPTPYLVVVTLPLIMMLVLPLAWVVAFLIYLLLFRSGSALVTARRGWQSAALLVTPKSTDHWHLSAFTSFPLRRGLGAALGTDVLDKADELGVTTSLRPGSALLRQGYRRWGFEDVEGSRLMRRPPARRPASSGAPRL